MSLTSDTRQQIIDLLSTHLNTPPLRRTAINTAFHRSTLRNQLDDVDGATADIIPAMVDRCDRHGTLDTNELALVALLKVVRKQVGGNIQTKIDNLIVAIHAENGITPGSTKRVGKLYSVPPKPEGYIEREKYLKPLIAALTTQSDKPVAITPTQHVQALHGTGGMGKSTLAAALCEVPDVRQNYPDGLFWLTIGKDAKPAERMGDVAHHFGDDRNAYQDVDRDKLRFSGLLKGKAALLILDDVWDHAAAVPFRDAVNGTRCRIVITTRIRAVARNLGATTQPLNILTPEEGRRLVASRLGNDTDPDTLPTEVDAIVELLGGHTLAVSLAAARLAEKGIDYAPRLLQRLQKRTGSDNPFHDLKLHDEDKNLNLELCLSLSYDDLSDDLKRRYRDLGVVAQEGVLGIEMAAALWSDVDAEDAEDALDDLVRAGLLRVSDVGEGYEQHTLLRAYARALLQRADNLDAAFFRYCDYVTEQAKQFDKLSLHEWGQLDDLSVHVDGVGEALTRRWNADSDNEPFSGRVGEFAYTVTNYVFRRPLMIDTPQGRVRRGLDWLEAGLAVYAQQGNKQRQSLLLNQLGLTYDALGERQKALDYYEQALEVYREIGDRGGEATTLTNLGSVYDHLGERQKALAYYEQALPIRRAVGDRAGEAATLHNISTVHWALGNQTEAMRYLQEALPIRREVGDRAGEASTLMVIGLVYDALGERQKALDYYQQALPIRRAVGDRAGEATTLSNLGGVYNALGERQKALDYYQQALPIHRDVGDRAGEATTLSNIASVYYALGERQKALEYYQQALPIQRAVGDRAGEATTLNNLGGVYYALGERQKALDYYQQALPIMRAVGDRATEAVTCFNMGRVYEALGDLDRAIEYVERCVEIEEQIGDPNFESDRAYLERLKRKRDGNVD